MTRSILAIVVMLVLLAATCSRPSKEVTSERIVAKDSTVVALEKELHEVAQDSVSEIIALKEEIQIRMEDSTHRSETIEVFDSTMVLGDTISWRVVKHTIQRNKSLEQFPTDTLIKLLHKKVIYPGGGGDNRRDWYELEQESRDRATALQTACLIKRSKLFQRPDGNFQLRTRKFSEAKELCTAERFYNQPVAGSCSGFGVSDNLFVTAGHCIRNEIDLHSYYVVYNFTQEDANQARLVFSPEEVYTPVEIVQTRDNGVKDFAVIRLDKTIPANRQAVLRTTDVAKGEPVFVIGYPCGLPLKYADGANVQDISSPDFFLADLDTYGGNSGSPVYDASHHVVGILVRGAVDFQRNYADNNCRYSNVCSSFGAPGCAGEGISRVNQFHQFIVN